MSLKDACRLTLNEAQSLVDRSPFGPWWGHRVDSVALGHVVLRLPHRAELERVGGVLQGGCAMTLADVAMWLATLTYSGPDEMAMTLSATTTFLRGARGDLVCEARVLRHGRRVVYGEATCTDASGSPVTHHVVSYIRP